MIAEVNGFTNAEYQENSISCTKYLFCVCTSKREPSLYLDYASSVLVAFCQEQLQTSGRKSKQK